MQLQKHTVTNFSKLASYDPMYDQIYDAAYGIAFTFYDEEELNDMQDNNQQSPEDSITLFRYH